MTGPNDITRTNWDGVFGMCEMEEAAKVVVAKAKRQGQWVPCSLEDMTTDLERKGFVELVYGGWMRKAKSLEEPWTYNGSFLPDDAFIERVRGVKKEKDA
jgi:hypothetical protein